VEESNQTGAHVRCWSRIIYVTETVSEQRIWIVGSENAENKIRDVKWIKWATSKTCLRTGSAGLFKAIWWIVVIPFQWVSRASILTIMGVWHRSSNKSWDFWWLRSFRVLVLLRHQPKHQPRGPLTHKLVLVMGVPPITGCFISWKTSIKFYKWMIWGYPNDLGNLHNPP